MKKLKVIQFIPQFNLAGAEIMVENLSVGLYNNNIDIKVVSLYNYQSAITDRLESYNIPIYYLNKKNGLDIKLLLKLYRLLKNEKPDVIHTHLFIMPYIIPIAIITKIPVKIHTIHNVAKKEVGKIRRVLHNIFYKKLNVVPISISPLITDSISEEYNISKSKINMVYNGINLKKCKVKTKYDITDKIKITHIGRFSEQKNHIKIIESFKLVNNIYPNTILRLIGTGELQNEIIEKVKELNIEQSVEFLGEQPNVYSYLNDSDIFIFPSLWEGMPITLIEAMATGLPIVATEVGGIPDMIENNVSGLLVSNNKEDISKAIIKLIKDENLRAKIGKNAFYSSKKFSMQNMSNDYMRIYKSELTR